MFKYIKSKAVFIAALLLLTVSSADAKFVHNENIINEKTVLKLEEIADELDKKTGVHLHLYAVQSINGEKISQYSKKLAKQFKEPYIILIFSKKEKKVDIISSKEESKKFDKEEVLSPYSGTIIPILVTKTKSSIKVDDKESAALLNGYADIAEQVAKYHNIELKSGIGSTNRDIINYLRFVFYGIILISLIFIIRRKFAKQ